MRHQAIRNIYPNVISIGGEEDKEWGVDNEGNAVSLDESLIAAETQKLEDAYKSMDYARKRNYAYPSVSDQLDAFWKGGDDLTSMKSKIDKVKSDFPKPDNGGE